MGPLEVVQELDGRDGTSPVIVQISGEVVFRHFAIIALGAEIMPRCCQASLRALQGR
jgi:hypothetical protein